MLERWCLPTRLRSVPRHSVFVSFPAAVVSVFLYYERCHAELINLNPLVSLSCHLKATQTSVKPLFSYMNELHHLSALCQPCCCKWLFCIEFPEYPGIVERLLYTNRPSSCYFSGDARLSRHGGRRIDRLSLSMQSSGLKETLERQQRQLRDDVRQELERWGGWECGGEYWH